MQNIIKAPSKRSKIEADANKYLPVCFGIMFILVLISAMISIIMTYDKDNNIEFFSYQAASDSYLMILTFIILFNRFIPISVYVTIDILKLFQAKFILWDLNLYCEKINSSPIIKNNDLIEDLGQIEFIFADKTGTLTYNQMEFKKCSIKGQLYDTIDELKMQEKTPGICEFLEILSLCHTVIPEDRGGITVYEAASQDEEALVQASKELGYKFISNSSGQYILEVNNECLDYKVIGINELTSERKRMSVVIEPMSDRNRGPVLYCKGADTVMFDRCTINQNYSESTLAHLESFASSGLRTLVLAKKELSSEEAEEFKKKYMTAKNALYNKAKRLEDIANEIENNMEYIGITAIEDKVHEGVSETISNLMHAGIKIFILTGDKPETAVNIAYSTKLFNSNMSIVTLTNKNLQETENSLIGALSKFLFYPNRNSSIVYRPENASNDQTSSFDKIITASFIKLNKDKLNIKAIPKRRIKSLNIGLVIDGISLSYIMSSEQLQSYLIMLFSISQSVICGRMSPQQKAQLVKLVKESFDFKPCTLAVGDGGNDVPMLQQANVGIGILGKEGSQAANSSDFAIPTFQYLDKLILYQGR